MKTKKRTLTKYAMGTGNAGIIKGYMPDPNTVFAQNNIDVAKAQYEASTNPFIMGGKALGGLTMGVGLDMFSNAGGFGAFKKQAMGTGPMGASGVPIETEEGEILETPQGVVTEEGGQKHSEGGNLKVVQPGTKIFSDQVKIAGKTMAERKASREREIAKLTKAVERDPSDILTKNTLKQMSEKFAIEEQQDLEVQEYANGLDEVYNYAMGTGKYGVQKFDDGTGKDGVEPWFRDWSNKTPTVDTFFKSMDGATYPPLNLNLNGIKSAKTPFDNFITEQRKTENFDFNKNLPTVTQIAPAFKYAPEEPVVLADSANANLSLGDMVGMGSSLYGGFAAMANTNKNRAMSQVNENEYADFGIDALQANEDATKFLSGQQDKALSDINLGASSAVSAGRNTARGVNQMRAMDAGVFVNTNKAKADVYDNFSKQMLAQLNAKAGIENVQDQMVMQGAATAKGLNDEDLDNYYSQLGADKQGLANMGMNLGKNLNVQKGNQDFLDMLPDLSAYGLGYKRGAKGKLEVAKIKD
jgi:hypothetical protein